MMENILKVDRRTFLAMPIIDTSIAVCICGDGDFAALKNKLVKVYGGNVAAIADGIETTIINIADAHKIELPPQPDFCKSRYTAADAARVTARLTRDGDGCPWDRAQTHESIRNNMIEEAYEAVDAIDKRDKENMLEEFGDVLLQSLLQSDIARRSGEFDFDDVCDGLCKKLIGRHTFIFGADSANSPDDALGLWEKAKAVEKNYDGVKNKLSHLPDCFPALLLCQKTHKNLKKAGAKTDGEAELDRAVASRDYVRIIAACVALLSDGGKDAEVELNAHVKAKIAEL